MADISKCQDELISLAEKQGYLTFDDILNASDAFVLSVAEVDLLSEAIQLRGILVYETAPHDKQTSEDEDYLDYSRTDYNSIFVEVLSIAPQLKTLIKEIKGFPAPQYGETNQLAMQIAAGNMFARERLFTLYMRSVVKIALSMTKQLELSLEDAISTGFLGLMAAIDKYDPDGFSAFHSYASMYIRQAIQRECNPIWMEYYFPAHIKERILSVVQKLNEYHVDFENDIWKDKELLEQVSLELQLSKNEVNVALDYYCKQRLKSCAEEIINQEMYGPDESIIPESPITDNDTVFEELLRKDVCAVVEFALSHLTEREAMVIKMRNGLDDFTVMTLEEIGGLLHITRERVRQIESKALRKLRSPRISTLLRDYLE